MGGVASSKCDGLEHVLTVMIDKDYYGTEYLNQMFIVPEHADTKIYDSLEHSIMTEKYKLQQDILYIIGIRADKPKIIPAANDEKQKIPMPADTTKSDGISKSTTFNNARKIVKRKLCCSTMHDDEYKRIYYATS
ncbi:uncharacterized protein LOC126837488 [Adelges cooleyi]|uniref:uncharacterized protein LOC126837488 n=1 Tax=Adelges cooleyi TaxID=133065 RepID=UPI00218063D8|nr:uncharacterized protein LOC126837488 [Adelges cooleyi]